MIIGLDVGGTHTDVVLLGKYGLLAEVKVLTDESDLFSTVLKGLEEITKGIDSKEIKRIVLSTTLTTNAIIQGKIPKVGLIVAGGPGIDQALFKIGDYYECVSGSIDHRGQEVLPLKKNEILSAAEKFKSVGIKNVGVITKFSTKNPKHESEIKELIKDSFEHVFLGHLISGNLNFPRRIATTFLNTAVYPVHKHFYEVVKSSLSKKGLDLPIHILKADGGTMLFDASLEFPGQTILSGPGASVMGAIPFAQKGKDTVVLDIGGTTTDIAVLINQVPLLEPLGIELGGYKTLIRALKTCSIGVGGDSHVVFENGNLKIGPERKGQAIAYGGPVPTTTDALFVLGEIKNGDKEKAHQGIKLIADKMGLSVDETAKKIFNLACQNILEHIKLVIDEINIKPVYTVHEVLEGYQINPKNILILGGPAPHFVKGFKELSDFEVEAVPRWGVANAIGASLARTTCEVIFFADTYQGIAMAPSENYFESVKKTYTKKDALNKAYEILKNKAIKRGADVDDLDMEVLEDFEFNMVKDFYTIGKNIRIKVQVKPGLVKDFESVIK
ncbi:MAG: hydantoinase/oxoprolinase family protein [Desulfobacterales bacterium]|nr:hydantoinase/oxoprolinase family protein [Desulfobacterales bacterium]